MKVAFVTNRPAHYRVPIFRSMSEHFDLEFFFTATSDGRWWTSEHTEETSGLRSTTGLTAAGLFGVLRRGGYDCVISSLTGRTHLGATAAAIAGGGPPLVLWAELWEYPRSIAHAIGRPLVRRLLRHADILVAGGNHTASWIEREVGRTRDILVLRNPVDNALFSQTVPHQKVLALRSSFRVDARTIGMFVGRLEPEKGLDTLLRAVSRLSADFGLVVIGSGSGAGDMREMAAELGVSERVHPVGWIAQSELPAYYRACDFLVMPSVSTRRVRETWGLVANEAMASGLPVIASDAVGAAAGGLVTNEETGLVVAEQDAVALAVAIERLCSDIRLRASLGAAAKERVAAYSFDNAAATFSLAVEQAVARRRNA